MKGRGIDHRQYLGAGRFGRLGRFFKPGVLANKQPHAHRVVRLARLKHAGGVARNEIAPLVKHLVIGQLLFGVGGYDGAVLQHAGAVVAGIDRHRAPTLIAALGVADHHTHAVQRGQLPCQRLQSLRAGLHKCGAQVQIFGGIAAQRQFGGEQQARALGVGCLGRLGNFLRVAGQITHNEIELRNANFESHEQMLMKTAASSVRQAPGLRHPKGPHGLK